MSTLALGSGPEYVVVCVDGPNADNQAAVWGAVNAFNNERYKLAAVIISGTCVDYRPDAPLGSRDDEVSTQVQEMHTARMAGLLARAGVSVPVFMGKPVVETDITTPIPHDTHVRHEDYDIYQDAEGRGRDAIAGNFNDALDYIAGLDNIVHLVVGGPFTEVAEMIKRKDIVGKLGRLAAQAGFELPKAGERTPIYSKLAFNVEVDEQAALETLLHYPGEMVLVPSTITRADEATFASAQALEALGIHQEIAEIFIRHRDRAEARHDLRQKQLEAEGKTARPYPALSIHDLQAVMALQQVLGEDRGVFGFERLSVDTAVRDLVKTSREREGKTVVTRRLVLALGYLWGNRTTRGQIPPRLVVRSQDAGAYKQRVGTLLAPLEAA